MRCNNDVNPGGNLSTMSLVSTSWPRWSLLGINACHHCYIPAMWLDDNDVRNLHHNLFVFDLEWIGDIANNPRGCKIWDIGCVHVGSGETFSHCVLPDLAGENLSEDNGGVDCVPPVTRSMILETRHGTLRCAVKSWIEWIKRTRRTSKPTILVAHNCFRADAIVLMHELNRCGSSALMGNVVFMDSLLHVRHALGNNPPPSFALHALCSALGVTEPLAPHRAITDSVALSQVLNKCSELHNCSYISGIAMPFGQVSLTVVSGIGVGLACRIERTQGVTDMWGMREYLYSKYGNMTIETCTEFAVSAFDDMPNERREALGVRIYESLVELAI